MDPLVSLAGTNVDAFIADAEQAELSEAAGFPSPPPPSFFILLALAYVRCGDMVMAEATLLRWRAIMTDAGRVPASLVGVAFPTRTTAPDVTVCMALLTVARQSMRHFYDVAFEKLRSVSAGTLASAVTSAAAAAAAATATATATGDGDDVGGIGDGGEAAKSAAAAAAAAEAALDSLAARAVRCAVGQSCGGGGTDGGGSCGGAEVSELVRRATAQVAEQLSISLEELHRRMEADAARRVGRAAALEAAAAKAVESGALVEAALCVGSLA